MGDKTLPREVRKEHLRHRLDCCLLNLAACYEPGRIIELPNVVREVVQVVQEVINEL